MKGKRAPKQEAEVIDRLTDPLVTIDAAAKASGVSRHVAGHIKKNLQRDKQAIGTVLKQVKTSHILDLIEDRLHTSLSKMDEKKLDKASAKDLAIVTGILIEKRQLLRGEPTQILSVEERTNLNDIIPQLIREAHRRGVTIDHDPVTQEARLTGGR